MWCLQETHFRSRDTYRLKVRGWKTIPWKWKAKECQSSNTHIRKNQLWNKDGYKRWRRILPIDQGVNPHEEDIAIVNIYAPNIGISKYIRQILTDIKVEIDSNTIIVEGFFNLSLTSMDRSFRQNPQRNNVFKWHIRSDGLNRYI